MHITSIGSAIKLCQQQHVERSCFMWTRCSQARDVHCIDAASNLQDQRARICRLGGVTSRHLALKAAVVSAISTQDIRLSLYTNDVDAYIVGSICTCLCSFRCTHAYMTDCASCVPAISAIPRTVTDSHGISHA